MFPSVHVLCACRRGLRSAKALRIRKAQKFRSQSLTGGLVRRVNQRNKPALGRFLTTSFGLQIAQSARPELSGVYAESQNLSTAAPGSCGSAFTLPPKGRPTPRKSGTFRSCYPIAPPRHRLSGARHLYKAHARPDQEDPMRPIPALLLLAAPSLAACAAPGEITLTGAGGPGPGRSHQQTYMRPNRTCRLKVMR